MQKKTVHNDHQAILDLTMELVRCKSVTPEDAGCLNILTKHMNQMGFSVKDLSSEGITNIWATHGTGNPLFIFAGHTDVVPPGPLEEWQYPPFEPTIEGKYLYGRGTADMKASLAAMIFAAKRFINAQPTHEGTLAFLLTSDEEGPAVNGTRHVIEELTKENIIPDFCVVGEPSSSKILGDTVRIGRRGSLNAKITVNGTQGHVAYPELAANPIHEFAPALEALVGLDLDKGNENFPASSIQISNIKAGTGASNVIPGYLSAEFNIRFSTEQNAQLIQDTITALIQDYQQDFEIEWSLSGNPFLTPKGMLRKIVSQSIEMITGQVPEESTSGGTSDGRFIAPTGCEVVEIGPVNRTIHKVNERIAVNDLGPLSEIYEAIVTQILCHVDD